MTVSQSVLYEPMTRDRLRTDAMQHRTDGSPYAAPLPPPCSPPLPAELSVAPDYAINGPADNAVYDMVHASATDDMCQCCDNEVAWALAVYVPVSRTLPPARLPSYFYLHELVRRDRELGCPAIESWVPLIHVLARDKSAMYKSLFSTGSLLFELLNGLLVPSRPTALCFFFYSSSSSS